MSDPMYITVTYDQDDQMDTCHEYVQLLIRTINDHTPYNAKLACPFIDSYYTLSDEEQNKIHQYIKEGNNYDDAVTQLCERLSWAELQEIMKDLNEQ